jgi:hypothetical protein
LRFGKSHHNVFALNEVSMPVIVKILVIAVPPGSAVAVIDNASGAELLATRVPSETALVVGDAGCTVREVFVGTPMQPNPKETRFDDPPAGHA